MSPFIPLKWKQNLPPLLTGKSVSCWRWKDSGLFKRENRTISPLSARFHFFYHSATHKAFMGGVLVTLWGKKSNVLDAMFKACRYIVPAAYGCRRWLSLSYGEWRAWQERSMSASLRRWGERKPGSNSLILSKIISILTGGIKISDIE